MVGSFHVLDPGEKSVHCSGLIFLPLLGSAHYLQLTEEGTFLLVMEAGVGSEPCSLPDSAGRCCESETYPTGKGRGETRLTHG